MTKCAWLFDPAHPAQTVEAEASRSFSVHFLGQKSATFGESSNTQYSAPSNVVSIESKHLEAAIRV